MAEKSPGGARSSRTPAKTPKAKPATSNNSPAPADNPAAISDQQPAAPGTPSATNGTALVLRTGTSKIYLPHTAPVPDETSKAKSTVTLAQAAMQWTYIVRNRPRWSTSPDSKKQQARAAEDFLAKFGVGEGDLQELANASMVEVSVPWTGIEAHDWPARILPWEFVIGGATQSRRRDKSITVIRHLDHQGSTRPRPTLNDRVLFVASAPRPLQNVYQFDTERELVRNNLDGAKDKGNWDELASPTADQLLEKLITYKPDIVHFAGIDTHEALSLLSQIEKEEGKKLDCWESDPAKDVSVKDGYVLKGKDKMLHALDAETLARIFEESGQPPRLVVFNFHNSGARIAALAVGYGAESAVGFQDSFDDDLAERFFIIFYAQLGRSDGNSAIAFRSAWEHIRNLEQDQQGTGVVHWSALPLLTDQASLGKVNKQFDEIHAKISGDLPHLVEPHEVLPGAVGDLIKVTVKVFDEFNYSMLHNNRTLFNKFTLAPARQWVTAAKKRVNPIIHGVTVMVSLEVGGAATYKQTLDVEFPFRDLSSEIQLPLTSALTRAVHESINTSVLVEVVWGEHVLYRNSLRMRLTPVDQWRDSDNDRRWLPSFVFPRDQAISELIDRAQRYVRVLRDDPSSGFDGYQSFNPTPSTPPAFAEEVDLQVQAVWSAIVYEMHLNYINPPPGYSSTLDSQRLRTPTMIRDCHSGTCIDLALFLAACLELIDVYPVIFLLDGHAFPGYWRSDTYHEEFLQTKADHIQAMLSGKPDEPEGAEVQDDSWFFKKDTCQEIVRYVRDGKLVPLETVRLTENCGFWEAVEAGMDNLADQTEFQAMVDIKLARDKLVTPLPILGE